jgi:hypothetical protein
MTRRSWGEGGVTVLTQGASHGVCNMSVARGSRSLDDDDDAGPVLPSAQRAPRQKRSVKRRTGGSQRVFGRTHIPANGGPSPITSAVTVRRGRI